MDAYFLFLKWLMVDYNINDDKLIKLHGAYFSGPVLRNMLALNPNDHIDLDFTEQYAVKLNNYYIARLSWTNVKTAGDIIYLGDCMLNCKYKDSLPKLKPDDFIIIDTSLHEEATHQYFLTYPAVVYSALGEPYGF